MQSNRSNIASSHASLQAPNSDEQPKKVIQDDDIWMSDGNLVIAVPCEDEDTVHIFKCHKSILATRSSVFESMFTLPQTETTETYEGLPVVQLRDDPKAMKALLKFLYNPTYVFRVSQVIYNTDCCSDWSELTHWVRGSTERHKKLSRALYGWPQNTKWTICENILAVC